MRVVIQRVSEASVQVNKDLVGQIGPGLLVLLGVAEGDTEEDLNWMLNKVLGLRIFNDHAGVMNRSLLDIDAELMVISQFTLLAATKKGNRPSYIRAANHSLAIPLYTAFCEKASKQLGKTVAQGVFGADMKIALVNDGPVTITIDSKNKE